jgi:hypothetical protein
VSDDERSPFDELDPPPSRLIAVGALVGGVLMVAAVVVVWGALTIAYGAEPFPWIAVVIVTAIPALLLAIGIDMVLRAFRGSSAGYWPIAAVVYLLVLVGLVALLKAADTQYAEQTARMESACSGSEMALLRSLPNFDGSVAAGDPTGDRYGACTITFHVQGVRSGNYVGHLSNALAAQGWTVDNSGLPASVSASRGGDRIFASLGATDDQGVTSVDVSTGGEPVSISVGPA